MLTESQKELLKKLVDTLDDSQKMWVAGYFSGLTAGRGEVSFAQDKVEPEQPKSGIKILYGSRSGNAEWVAKKLADTLKEKGIKADSVDLNGYKPKNIKKEKKLILVVSTHGAGNPPAAAYNLYDYIFSSKPGKLDFEYAVCALGDSSYEHFCKAGADFDHRFKELGAKRLMKRVDCDVDFEETSLEWINEVVSRFSMQSEPTEFKHTELEEQKSYSRKNPFQATILEKKLLSGKGSNKEVYHIALSLKGSGMEYQPGDAIGILPKNENQLVEAVLNHQGYNGEAIVSNGVGAKALKDILTHHYELTSLSKDVLSRYAKLSADKRLEVLLASTSELKDYVRYSDILDLTTDFPGNYAPEEFLHVLRKLQPRLYSIASAPEMHSDEVHITISAVRSNYRGRKRKGVCSTQLADKLKVGDSVPVFIDHNPLFKLPADSGRPIIMIGPGTGIAPFRSFLLSRSKAKNPGKSWLFFGAQHRTTDYLYEAEWKEMLESGLLSRLDLAFSRDTEHKVYVQHRLREQAKEIYAWLQEGSYLYVCGDMRNMANDVFETIKEIVRQEGEMSTEEAHQIVRQMQKEGRYQEDVY